MVQTKPPPGRSAIASPKLVQQWEQLLDGIATLDSMATLAGLKDLDHRYLFANHQLETLYNVPPGGLVGARLEMPISPENIVEIHARENEVVRTGKAANSIEQINVNGRAHVWETIRFPFCDHNGNIVGSGFVAIDTDGSAPITEKQRETLEQARQQTVLYCPQNHDGRSGTAAVPSGATENRVPGLVQLIWHKTYISGNPTIDREHFALFEHANNLLSAVLIVQPNQPKAAITKLFYVLLAEILQHFRDEEGIFHKVAFPEAEEHHQFHIRLLARAVELARQFAEGQLNPGDLLSFLAYDLVAQHILSEDRKLLPYINQDFPVEA